MPKSSHKACAVLLALSFPFFGTMVAMNEARHSPATAKILAEVRGEPQPVRLYRLKPRVVELATLTPGCDVHNWGCVLGAEHNQRLTRR